MHGVQWQIQEFLKGQEGGSALNEREGIFGGPYSLNPWIPWCYPLHGYHELLPGEEEWGVQLPSHSHVHLKEHVQTLITAVLDSHNKCTCLPKLPEGGVSTSLTPD